MNNEVDNFIKKILSSPEMVDKLTKGQSCLGEEYHYLSLPLCVLDSVFSVGVKYKSVQNVVKRYCTKFQLPRWENDEQCAYDMKSEHTITEFINNVDNYGDISKMAENIICNRQRTSPRGGQLKIQSAYEWAKILKKNGIETLDDFKKLYTEEIGEELKEVKGQGSGVSLKYLCMLAGNTDSVKPDRMLIRFFKNQPSDKSKKNDEIQSLCEEIVSRLKNQYHDLDARLLDYIIWNYQRNQ